MLSCLNKTVLLKQWLLPPHRNWQKWIFNAAAPKGLPFSAFVPAYLLKTPIAHIGIWQGGWAFLVINTFYSQSFSLLTLKQSSSCFKTISRLFYILSSLDLPFSIFSLRRFGGWLEFGAASIQFFTTSNSILEKTTIFCQFQKFFMQLADLKSTIRRSDDTTSHRLIKLFTVVHRKVSKERFLFLLIPYPSWILAKVVTFYSRDRKFKRNQ